jgi:uncharacterized protein
MKENYLSAVEIRFYEELNDFLPTDRKGRAFFHPFFGKPTVKELIEGIGVPHTEIDLILINGESVPFDHHVQHNDRVAVYPRFESLDISTVTHLRSTPLRSVRFITDVHLGKLARYLRMLGFDTLYENDFSDEEIIERALREMRIILTRDLGILKNKRVTHGYFLRHTHPLQQLKEVLRRFDLQEKIAPFSRCLACNGELLSVEKKDIEASLLPETKRYYATFFQCPRCKRIYWEGSHHDRMKKIIASLEFGPPSSKES